jgi:hypothetical protein
MFSFCPSWRIAVISKRYGQSGNPLLGQRSRAIEFPFGETVRSAP